MSAQEDLVPVDTCAVKKYGVERWQKEFFWPVSDAEFTQLYMGIENILRKYIDAEPEEIGDLLLIQRTLVREYLHFLHALKAVDAFKRNKKEIFFSEHTLWYKNILNDSFEEFNIAKKGRVKYDFVKRMRLDATDFLRTAVYNMHFRSNKGPDGFYKEVYGSLSEPMKQYIKKKAIFPRFVSRREWAAMEAPHNIPEGLKRRIDEISVVITGDLEKAASLNGITLLEKHTLYLRNLTCNVLTYAAKMLYLARQKARGAAKRHLLTSSLGGSFSRALYITLRKQGGKVTCFSHGGHIGLYDTPLFAFSQFALADEFMAYTRNSAGLLESIRNNHPPLKNNSVAIKSCDSDEFLKMLEKYKECPLPKDVRRIMLIGYPHTQWRKPSVAASLSLIQLDLELRLIDALKNSGYELFYKVHPDRAKEVEGIFEGRAKVLKGYFENYLSTVDAYLFGTIRTTAFTIALCTNKPIICIRVEPEPYKCFSRPMELLKKRCTFVSAGMDDRNRIVFNEKELQDAFSEKTSEPNTEFLETYMIP
jgi:hypothetical protein